MVQTTRCDDGDDMTLQEREAYLKGLMQQVKAEMYDHKINLENLQRKLDEIHGALETVIHQKPNEDES